MFTYIYFDCENWQNISLQWLHAPHSLLCHLSAVIVFTLKLFKISQVDKKNLVSLTLCQTYLFLDTSYCLLLSYLYSSCYKCLCFNKVKVGREIAIIFQNVINTYLPKNMLYFRHLHINTYLTPADIHIIYICICMYIHK